MPVLPVSRIMLQVDLRLFFLTVISMLPAPLRIFTFYSYFIFLPLLYFLVLLFVLNSVWFLFRGFHLPVLQIPRLKIDLSGQCIKLTTVLTLKCSFGILVVFFLHLRNVICSLKCPDEVQNHTNVPQKVTIL